MAKHAQFRFYEELNDFLSPARRKSTFTHVFTGSPAVKDTIEALGVPHTEVDLILVNGVSVPFSHRLADGDRVAVYPVFESLDISPVTRLRPEPLREPRFIPDVHLGTLARYLRLLGFDTAYDNDADDHEIVARAAAERRIILTRDKGLLKYGAVTHGAWIRATVPRNQLVEVLERFDLARRAAPFTRCLACNGLTCQVEKADIRNRLEPLTAEHYERFKHCGSCGRIYWEGSHYARMRAFVEALGITVARQEPSSDRTP